MRHKRISSLKTRIRKKRQVAIIEFEGEDGVVFLSPNNIKQNTSLEVNELELLLGSKLRVSFYEKGEVMFGGESCKKENLVVKEYYFELEKPVEILRTENKGRLLPFQMIVEIFHFNKFNKDQVGIKTERNEVIFLPQSRFEVQSGLAKEQQHILIGSFINPEYYRVGEILSNGKEVTADNKLLRWINLRYCSNIEGMHESFEDSIAYYDGEDFGATSMDTPSSYGYDSWEDMAFQVAFDGDVDAWNHYNQ